MASDIGFGNRPVRKARWLLQRNALFFEDKNLTCGVFPHDVEGYRGG